jgi:hypothetical protein
MFILKFFNAKEQPCWTQTRKTHLYRIAPLRLQLKIATKRRFAKLFVSTIILTQPKKFQNRFWTISRKAGLYRFTSAYGGKKKIGYEFSIHILQSKIELPNFRPHFAF